MITEYLDAMYEQVKSDLSPEIKPLGVCISTKEDGSYQAEVVVLDGFTDQILTMSEPAPETLHDPRLEGIHTALRLVARMEEYLREDKA